ncbi:MAG: hypothetical protein NVSMB18_05950 [Acetobacteraceae bacterium]
MSAAVRAGGYQGADSVHTRALQAMGAALGGAPGFSLVADVTQDGSKATALLAQVESGALDLCYFASSYLAARVPALLSLDLPFTFADREAAYRALDGALGDVLRAAVGAGTGFVVLALWDNGVRHLSNRVRPLARPADCRGLTIRTLDNALHRDVFASFGFRPITIDVRDLPAAVHEGRVDAQENPLTNTVNFGLHRTHRFHSLTGHLFGVALLLANRGWYERLPAGRRAVLDAAVAEASGLQRQFAAAEDARCLAVLRVDGAEVLGAEALDLPAFRQAASGLRDAARAEQDLIAGPLGLSEVVAVSLDG